MVCGQTSISDTERSDVYMMVTVMVCGQTSISDTNPGWSKDRVLVMVCGQTSISDTTHTIYVARVFCYGLRTDIDQ